MYSLFEKYFGSYAGTSSTQGKDFVMGPHKGVKITHAALSGDIP